MASKYDPLARHLAALGAATITLPFAEVEAVVGALPKEARSQSRWWSSTAEGLCYHVHTTAWRRAGYVADHPDFAAETVTFRRVAS